jgi:3-oxoacyl-[acyl-carrier-protein] synthase II
MPVRRVVVTGLGAVSPYGLGVEAMMRGLRSGSSAVVGMGAEWSRAIPGLTCLVGAPLAERYDPKSIPRKFRRSMGPTAMMAYLAGKEALAQAKAPESLHESGRMGVCFSSTTGSAASLANGFEAYQSKAFPGGVSSSLFFQIMSHTCAANVAHAFGVRGRVVSPDAACASSAQAVGLAFEFLQNGKQDLMLCGGADELHPLVVGCFDLVQASSHHFNDTPGKTPRPFDKDRDGTVCGEGAGAVALESEESARARGADILAEILGFDTLADGGHLAEPRTESIRRCLYNALDNSGVSADRIDYVNAHGTGTIAGDAAEAEAVREVFGEGNVPVSSLKGHMGHTLGASGALELIASIEMLRRGCLIPTLNLEELSEDCKGVDHLRNGVEERPIRCFVKNSFAFGGINTVLVLKRYEA